MKCEIVEDLMPLYVDGLCSEETTKEIKEHMSHCELCNEKMKEIEMPIEVMPPEEEISIEPMKKVKRKLHKKNTWILAISLLSILVIGSISYLSYHQINRSGISFEIIYEFFHFQKVGREFADGNLEPLLECLAIPGEDTEHITYAKAAYDGDLEAYVQDAKEDIRKQYKALFEGKKLVLKDVVSEYVQDDFFETKNSKCLLIGLSYEVDGISYLLRLERNNGKKFYITDGFVSSAEINYTETDIPSEDTVADQTKISDEGTKLLEHQESVFRCLQPYNHNQFFLIKNLVRHFYKQSTQKNTDTVVLNAFTNYFIKEDYLNMDEKTKAEYSIKIHSQFEELARMGYGCSDVDFLLQGYDKEKHMYRYQVIYTFTHETQKCYLLMDCYRNSNIIQEYLILIPKTVRVFGDDVPEEIKKKLANIWE